MKISARLFVAVSLAAALAAGQPMAQTPVAPAATSGPIIQPGGLRKISAHVWAIPDNSVGGVTNIGIIVGSKATLVVDTGMGPRNGEIVLKEAQKLSGANALYLVTTHVHPEHDLGAQAFPATTKMIRSTTQVEDIAQNGMTTADAFRGRSAINAELLKDARFRAADITFGQTYDLDLGGVRVKLIATGLNHTLGDTAIWVAGDDVLFTGDLAMSNAPAFNNPKASVKHWQATLVELAALRPKAVVPSHGPLGDAGYIAGYRGYFTAIQTRAAELKRQGKTVEEAVSTITAELSGKLPAASNRLGSVIRSAYAEAV